jgi:hypothetical protein
MPGVRGPRDVRSAWPEYLPDGLIDRLAAVAASKARLQPSQEASREAISRVDAAMHWALDYLRG